MSKQFFAIIAPIALCVALTGCGPKKATKEEVKKAKEVPTKTVSVDKITDLEQTTEIVVHLDDQETTQA